jgi:hypothetical protein
LGKVKAFLEALIGFGLVPTPVEKKSWKLGGPEMILSSTLTGGIDTLGENGAPFYVEVLRQEANYSVSEKASTVRLGDPLGKDLIVIDYLLGLPLFDVKISSLTQGNLACHSSVENVGEDMLIVKGKLQSPLWAWKGQLVRLKTEVDRALLSILEGIEKCGLAQKPNGAGRKKVGKRWAPKSKARLVCNPKPNLKFGMELESMPSLGMG